MKTPRRNEDLAWRKLGPNTIIIDSRINKEVHSLNEMGALIWSLLDGEHTVDQIADVLLDNFEIGKAEAKADVGLFCDELVKKGLVHYGE